MKNLTFKQLRYVEALAQHGLASGRLVASLDLGALGGGSPAPLSPFTLLARPSFAGEDRPVPGRRSLVVSLRQTTPGLCQDQ